jgi:hypothetical protein
VHVKSGLSKHECASIGDTRHDTTILAEVRDVVLFLSEVSTSASSKVSRCPESALGDISSASINKEARAIDVASGIVTDRFGTRESVKSVRKSIDSIGVVEWLSTKGPEQNGVAVKGCAVVNVSIRLNNPDELLARVVEVQLDLVAGGTNRLVTSELELLNEVLMRVLGHASALISVKEHVVDVEGSSHKGLVVSAGSLHVSAGVSFAGKRVDSPQALINRADVKVDTDLVVLKSDQRKGETRVTAVPELERHVKGGLRKGVARSAHLAGSARVARSINISELRVSDVGKLGGVTNHLVVATLLLLGESELVPDVHPVTVLAIDALATNLNLNLSDELLTREIKPASELSKVLVDLRKSHLKIGAVGKITVTCKGAGNTATEISLAVESLFNRLHSKVCVATVSHLPESNLRIARKINILGAVSDKLH